MQEEGDIISFIFTSSFLLFNQKIAQFHPGVYAVAVHGSLPAETINSLDAHNIKYHTRYFCVNVVGA